MRKLKDVMHYCRRCNKDFPVQGFVAKELAMFNNKAYCPECGKNDVTERISDMIKKKGSLSDPASPKQIDLIRGLGGSPRNVKNKGEAGEIITQLKKEKEMMKLANG